MALLFSLLRVPLMDEVLYETSESIPIWLIALIAGVAGMGLFLLFYLKNKRQK